MIRALGFVVLTLIAIWLFFAAFQWAMQRAIEGGAKYTGG